MHRYLSALAVALVVVSTVCTPVYAGTTSDNLLDLAAKGGPAVGLGFGVSRSPWAPLALPSAAPTSSATDDAILPTLEPHGRAVSLDVKLRWPSAGDTPIGFEPYAVLGPALMLNSPHEPYSLFGTPADPVLRVGAKLGAGFNWQLNKAMTLFGSYDMTRTTGDGVSASSGPRMPTSGAATGYDALYGIRFRY
jgi:hypothetical protein